MPINGRMDKLIVVYSYDRILPVNKQTTDTCNAMGEAYRHVGWKKPQKIATAW